MMRVLFHSQPSHEGRENQDFVESRRVGNAHLLALADGQGGRAGGALAARLAVASALDFLEGAQDPFDFDTLRHAIAVADETVEADDEAGLTTLVLLCVSETQIGGASVGDSMALHIGVHEEVDVSERQRKNPPLGSGAAMGTPFRVHPQVGEQILMMSDGVFRWVDFEVIARICWEEDYFGVLPRLLGLQKRNENGELPDDWSAVLVRI